MSLGERIYLLAAIIALFLLCLPQVLAQDPGVISITDGNYKISLEKSELNLTENTPFTLKFVITDTSTGLPATYSYARVSITGSGEELQSYKLFNEGGQSSLKTELMQGAYNARIYFYNSNTQIAKASFTFDVGSSDSESGYVESLMYLLLIIFGISIVLMLYMRYARKKYEEDIIYEVEKK